MAVGFWVMMLVTFPYVPEFVWFRQTCFSPELHTTLTLLPSDAQCPPRSTVPAAAREGSGPGGLCTCGRGRHTAWNREVCPPELVEPRSDFSSSQRAELGDELAGPWIQASFGNWVVQ